MSVGVSQTRMLIAFSIGLIKDERMSSPTSMLGTLVTSWNTISFGKKCVQIMLSDSDHSRKPPSRLRRHTSTTVGLTIMIRARNVGYLHGKLLFSNRLADK